MSIYRHVVNHGLDSLVKHGLEPISETWTRLVKYGKRQNADPRSVDYLRGPGPWTTFVDHGPLQWTTLVDHSRGPLSWTTLVDHSRGPLARHQILGA
jgi:hypothetical protein